MKNIIFAVSLFLTLPVFSNALAEELDQQKKQAIDELLAVTGASKIGEMFGNAFIDQMTAILKQSNPDVDPRAFDIVRDEVTTIMREEMVDKKALNEISYPVYHKYLTLADINQLIEFYKSPIGQKVIDVMPRISAEAMEGGQQLANSIAPIIQERLQKRFEKEGISLK